MWKVYTDGGCKPNPGKGSYCAALYKGDTLIESVGGYLQETTNNKAEYRACYAGLKLMEEHCDTEEEIIMCLDSQLVIKHLTGEWKVKDETLRSIYMKCHEKVNKKIRFEWVKGHSGNRGNDYADTVCTYFIERENNNNNEGMIVKAKEESKRLYLNCPYGDKDEAKSLGARWDGKKKKWWTTEENEEIFSKWIEK